MGTDSSGEESVFTDCASSGVERGERGGHRRQVSVTGMFHRAGSRKPKRLAPGLVARSPPDAAPPAAKRAAATGSAERPAAAGTSPAAAVELSAAALAAIQHLINAGNTKVISALDARMDILERRISILEGECMDKDEEIRRLNQRLEQRDSALDELQMRVEGIDANRRLSSLIFACEDFVSCKDEDIEEKVTQVINQRLPRIKMTVDYIQAAHRLQGKNKVIVRFVKRRLRDALYDSRFELFSGGAERRQRNAAPLYLTESLTPSNRLLYTALLDARKSENGARISSVFTRRGQVFCRTEKGGANIKVPNWERLQHILEGAARGSPTARGGRGDGSPSSRPAGRGWGPPPAAAMVGVEFSSPSTGRWSASAPGGAAAAAPVPAVATVAAFAPAAAAASAAAPATVPAAAPPPSLPPAPGLPLRRSPLLPFRPPPPPLLLPRPPPPPPPPLIPTPFRVICETLLGPIRRRRFFLRRRAPVRLRGAEGRCGERTGGQPDHPVGGSDEP